jgi:hypothetical protein
LPLRPPPRDTNGVVVPHDHQDIAEDDGIIRRISDEHIVSASRPGTRRISSMAFKGSSDAPGGMSVDIESLIIEAGQNPREFVTTLRFMGSVYFKAGFLRSVGLLVGYDPLPENAAHGEVWGNFSRGVQRHLRAAAIWYVEIDGVSLVP